MKAFISIGIVSLFLLSFSSSSQCLKAPFTESFDNTTQPSCVITSAQFGGPWQFDQTIFVFGCPQAVDHTGNLGSYATMRHFGLDTSVVLEFDTIDVSGLTNPYLTFYYYICDVGYTPDNILAIETFDGTAWVGVDTLQEGTGNWKEYNYDLSGRTFGNDLLKVRFRAETGGAFNDFQGDQGLDDISITELPSCFKPSSIIASEITDSSVNLSWTEKDSANQWEINYDEVGVIEGKGKNSVIADTTPEITLNGLKPATEYIVFIRSICGVGDSSSWVSSTFTTDCPIAFIPPYNQSFDEFPPQCWGEAFGGTPSSGPTNTNFSFWSSEDYLNDSDKGKAARLRITFSGNNNWILSPPFDLSQPTDYTLFVDAGITSLFGTTSSNMGSDDTVKILISTDSGSTWNSILDLHNNNKPSNKGDVYAIDLNTYNGVDNRFAIWGSDGVINDFEDYDFFIDNFEILPPCDTPKIGIADNITATTAILNWTEEGEATKWQIQYDTSGFTPGTGRNTFISENLSLFVKELRTETDYDFYVRAICRPADTSEWSEKATFRTLVCSPVANPSVDEIRTVDADISWTETGDANLWEVQYDTLGFAIGEARNSVIIENDTFNRLAPLRADTDYDFYVRAICVAGDSSQWSTKSSFQTNPCFEASGLSSNPSSNLAELSWIENGSAIQWEIEYDTSGFTSGSGRNKKIVDSIASLTIFNLRSNTTYDYYVRVICGPEDTSSYSAVHTFTTESCKTSTNLLASVSSNMADLSWTENGTAIAWEIEYDTAGFLLGTGKSKILLDTKTTLSSLRETSDYEWYIRSICGPEDTSNWSAKASFKTFAIVDECSYKLKLQDERGNGWTGNNLAVKVGNSATNYTLSNGSEEIIHLDVNLGDSIVLDYLRGGTFTTEVSFELFNAKNEKIFSSGVNPPTGKIFTDTVRCPSCFIPTNLVNTGISKDTAFVSWSENGSATKWIVEWDHKGFVPEEARNSTVINADTFASLTDLESLTEYDFYVRSICEEGDTSGYSLVGSFRSGFSCPPGAVCASYTAGDIDSDYDFTSLNVKSSCPESLTLTIPAGNRVDSIFTIYDMTSTESSFSWISEQRSWLYSPTTQIGEDSIVLGVGNSSGTFVYERTLDIANKFFGDIVIEMHAGRDQNFGPTGCRSDYIKVDNNTWNIAAYYSPIPSCVEPLQLKIQEVSDKEAKVNWLDLGSATQYEVEWDFEGFTPGSASNSMIVNADTFTTITGLSEYSNYEFSVRAICATADSSIWSEKESFTTKCGPAPSGIEVEETDVNALVSWNATKNSSSWIVEWDTAGYTPGLQRNSVVIDIDTFITLSGLTKSTKYDLYIRAICAPGDTSSRSILKSFTTLSCVGVSNLTASDISIDTVNLRWEERGSATSWQISYDTANYSLGNGIRTVTSNNPFTLKELTPEKDYDFYVRSICADGDTSLWSQKQTFRTLSPPYYPIGEINSEDTNGRTDSIGLTVRISGIVMGVDLDVSSGYNFTVIDLSSGSQEGIAIINDVGINNYQVNQGDSIMVGGIIDQVNGITALSDIYKIDILATNVREPKPIIVSEPSEETESKWIQIDSTEVIVGSRSLGSTNMTFSKNKNQFTVRIESVTDVDDNVVITPIGRGDSICSIIGIGSQFDDTSPFNSGYELIPARYSDIIRRCIIVNLDEQEENTAFIEIFPNPNHGEFILRTSGFSKKPIQLIIRDLKGRIVLDEMIINTNSDHNKEINLLGNPSGIYIITLFDGEKTHNKKVIID